jgi:hypothetical protein
MPRYFFNITDGETVIDEHGYEMENLAAARHEAMVSAGEMLRDYRPSWTGAVWEMWVTDRPGDAGATLLSLKFSAGGS